MIERIEAELRKIKHGSGMWGWRTHDDGALRITITEMATDDDLRNIAEALIAAADGSEGGDRKRYEEAWSEI